jgi:hypothetical protein
LELTEEVTGAGCGRRCVVSRRPTAWAGSELTLAQLLAVDVSSAKAPNLDRAVPRLGSATAGNLRDGESTSPGGAVYRRPDPTNRRRVLLTVTAHAVVMPGRMICTLRDGYR